MRAINEFLLKHGLSIATNPCVSPDFCLDWPGLSKRIESGGSLKDFPKSRFETAAGTWTLLEDPATGDCAWRIQREPAGNASRPEPLEARRSIGGHDYFPATWENLLRLKNLAQEHNPASTIFPTAAGDLGSRTIGVGARFTTLHWPAVEWAMSALEIGLTANQNSIPRELVYDTDAMLAGQLDTVPFPFIGASVPEGHQGQSVEGMSHGAVLSKLKTGFHRRQLAWSFNADHQPIGGKFDSREDALVRGCLLASYITFDLSPELTLNKPAKLSEIDPPVIAGVRDLLEKRVPSIENRESKIENLLGSVWPAILKMKARDEKYRLARETAFTTEAGRTYLRELSIDELPGLTTPDTTAVMLALCEVLGMRVHFVAPAFGFQKNAPYPDNTALRRLVQSQWQVCAAFGVSIGFHSGSGKSADNYRLLGEITGGNLEIKTSGRYTYEMGVALSESTDSRDQALWRDWYNFTVEMALAGAFSTDATEQKMARSFIAASLEGRASARPADGPAGAGPSIFASPATLREAMDALPPSPDHMFFFEYNFLFVLAAGGQARKAALGDHSPAGYAQRARFYAISPQARLNYSRRVAEYLVFLAETTGLAPAIRCSGARRLLNRYGSLDEMINDISR